MVFYTEPKATVVAQPHFLAPSHLPVRWGQGHPPDDASALVEFSGRLCYQSHHNPAGRTTPQYIDNIFAQRHGSVLEHATFSLLLEQVSRSLTHELVRHRAGMAYSQVSQRFVDSRTVGFVVPPAYLMDPARRDTFVAHCCAAAAAYEALLPPEDASMTTAERKAAREAAREVLPNATETKIVATGNARAWRTILELRGHDGASAEMRRLMRAVFPLLYAAAPPLFADFTFTPTGIVPAHSKV